MSRPKPTILLEKINQTTHRAEQVLAADAIYAVFYKDSAFNLKSFSTINSNAEPKYKKTSFSNPGHAIALASRLNKLYECSDFTVVKLTDGTIVD